MRCQSKVYEGESLLQKIASITLQIIFSDKCILSCLIIYSISLFQRLNDGIRCDVSPVHLTIHQFLLAIFLILFIDFYHGKYLRFRQRQKLRSHSASRERVKESESLLIMTSQTTGKTTKGNISIWAIDSLKISAVLEILRGFGSWWMEALTWKQMKKKKTFAGENSLDPIVHIKFFFFRGRDKFIIENWRLVGRISIAVDRNAFYTFVIFTMPNDLPLLECCDSNDQTRSRKTPSRPRFVPESTNESRCDSRDELECGCNQEQVYTNFF